MPEAKEILATRRPAWTAWAGLLSLPVALVVVNLWLFSDARWLEAMVEQAVQSSSRERAGIVRSAMNLATDSGALGIMVAGRSVWLSVRIFCSAHFSSP